MTYLLLGVLLGVVVPKALARLRRRRSVLRPVEMVTLQPGAKLPSDERECER